MKVGTEVINRLFDLAFTWNTIDKCHLPRENGSMTTKITVDKAGRVVLPKQLRDELRLTAGSALELETEGERITLRPVRQKAALRKEFGIWVFQGPASDDSIPDIIDDAREKRLQDLKL